MAAAPKQHGAAMVDEEEEKPAIVIRNLDFRYTKQSPVVLHGLDFQLPRGARLLLTGDNGAGKTTMLRLLAGKHIHPHGAVELLGHSAFYDTSFLNMHRAFLGCDWGRRTVAFAGHGCALQADILVEDMMKQTQAMFPERRDMLIRLLGVNPKWRMHQVSDGQRRRVQLFLQLLRPSDVLFLDEITVDLDVITRSDFLQFLKEESEQRGVTIVYATHIFDGLDSWGTHLMFLAYGRMVEFQRTEECAELVRRKAAGEPSPLLRTIMHYIRTTREQARQAAEAAGDVIEAERAGRAAEEERLFGRGDGYVGGRLARALTEALSVERPAEKDDSDSKPRLMAEPAVTAVAAAGAAAAAGQA